MPWPRHRFFCVRCFSLSLPLSRLLVNVRQGMKPNLINHVIKCGVKEFLYGPRIISLLRHLDLPQPLRRSHQIPFFFFFLTPRGNGEQCCDKDSLIHLFIDSPIRIISAVGTSTLVSTYLWRVCMFQILPASVAVAVVWKILILSGLKVKFPQPPLSDLKSAGLSKNPEVNILGNIWHCQQCSAFYHWTFLCLYLHL